MLAEQAWSIGADMRREAAPPDEVTVQPPPEDAQVPARKASKRASFEVPDPVPEEKAAALLQMRHSYL